MAAVEGWVKAVDGFYDDDFWSVEDKRRAALNVLFPCVSGHSLICCFSDLYFLTLISTKNTY